jgi:hypothetical protein
MKKFLERITDAFVAIVAVILAIAVVVALAAIAVVLYFW